jgi:hypothetical protein
MKRWLVVSREYGVVMPLLDDGSGPTEYGCDVIAVEAQTPRDAKVLAVRLARQHPRRYGFVDHYADECPFTGMRVYPDSREVDSQ